MRWWPIKTVVAQPRMDRAEYESAESLEIPIASRETFGAEWHV